jgi:hypothetical protein
MPIHLPGATDFIVNVLFAPEPLIAKRSFGYSGILPNPKIRHFLSSRNVGKCRYLSSLIGG